MKSRRVYLISACLWLICLGSHLLRGDTLIDISAVPEGGKTLKATASDAREHTWWFPEGASHLTLPIAGGIQTPWPESDLASILKERSPWDLKELPVLGLRYGNRQLTVILPWPHYAELILEERVGIRFSFPRDRNNTTPCDLVLRWAPPAPLAIAKVFRAWRKDASQTGSIPRARLLHEKIQDQPKVAGLIGAPHFYLWGPAGFSRHDIKRPKWIPFARALQKGRPGSVAHQLHSRFTPDERNALKELADSEWPLEYLTLSVAAAIDRCLQGRAWNEALETDLAGAYQKNRAALVSELGSFMAKPNLWGDGFSIPLLNALKESGLDQAVLILSDLYRETTRPEVAKRAAELGYLIGPYDSYHSVHSPEALPDDTWETAQFDATAFTDGRVVKEAGRRQGGFKGRGFHFSPQAAWPYVQERVQSIQNRNHYSTWFIDCDATGECFDDYHPQHAATKIDDMHLRRKRLQWLQRDRDLLVGSEGGSILFADVIHFGHGVHTPYIGHLHPGFRDRNSPHYLGRHWPPDTPEQSFKSVRLPDTMISPYFDPKVRIPLYQAVLGDELIATHHWSFDSLKLSNVEHTRALLEILYAVPPMYHINRATWPGRKQIILDHMAFWGPLHQAVATIPLTRFEWLSQDKMVQRTTYHHKNGSVQVTVNFGNQKWGNFPPQSTQITGVPGLENEIYVR